MRNCCCCDVRTGSIITGALNLFVSLLVLFPMVTYLGDWDDPIGINPIKENQRTLENVLEDILREHNWTQHTYPDIMTSVRDYLPTAVLVAASLAAVSATAAFMLILGVRCQLRCLLVPWLVLTMLDIIVAGAGGIIAVVALFYANIIPGVVSAIVYLLLALISLYSWAAVLAAYKILGHDAFMYSPAPSKPVADYYPSAPQHFDMGEYRTRREYGNQFG